MGNAREGAGNHWEAAAGSFQGPGGSVFAEERQAGSWSGGVWSGRRDSRHRDRLREALGRGAMVIEVERKFALGQDTERRLQAAGGQPRGGRSFLDRYYDTEQRALTRADHWLRNRSGRWQLKSPTTAGLGPGAGETPEPGTAPGTGETPEPGTAPGTGETPEPGTAPGTGETPEPGTAPGAAPGITPGTGAAPCRDGGATRYRETETEAEIMALLRGLLPGLVGPGGTGDIERLVTARLLREFAAIHTQRSSWQLPGGVTVDLDQTDFGHRLGEIEVTVAGEDQVPAALSRIQAVAQELGG
ncbi:thiamine-triphosphatase [Leucoraja erinacea]|uniref:thiamine-triphosphatase n=1 Tax=Leucoraja erinaceus TaxID=7782 RepID=UPI002453F57D|nr:thiamine-triphosphatase [Leucoraja erinacea]